MRMVALFLYSNRVFYGPTNVGFDGFLEDVFGMRIEVCNSGINQPQHLLKFGRFFCTFFATF